MAEYTDNTGYYTIKEASKSLNIPYWKLLRAVNAELIPHHRLLNSTKYVKLPEVAQAMQAASCHAEVTAEAQTEN